MYSRGDEEEDYTVYLGKKLFFMYVYYILTPLDFFMGLLLYILTPLTENPCSATVPHNEQQNS